MPRIIGKLTSRRVATAKPRHGRRALVLGDGGGLWLQATLGDDGTTVRRSWVFRYEIGGRRREMGLGATHTRSLAEARDKARSLRQLLLENVDPLEAREADRRAKLAEAARTKTFRQCAEAYLGLHADDGWSRRHLHQWRTSLRDYAFPTIGEMLVRDVDEAAVMRVVQPIWAKKTTTAARVLNRIRLVIDYASASGFRNGDNPARHVAAALPKKAKIARVRHFAALPWQDVPEFMSELRGVKGIPALCLEFVVLTGVRTGEALGATWDEIDHKAKTWTIARERMKGGKEHRVPLSARALEILDGLPGRTGYLFGGSKALPETALRKQVLRRLHSSATTHGFRATFRTWCDEQTNFPHHVVEQALAHTTGNAVERAYKRGDLFERRRKLMDQWASFCTKSAPAGKTVIPLRRSGATA